jgi:hypothetical protein
MQDVFLAIAMIISGPRLDLPQAEIEARFTAQCVGGRWEAQCPALRTEIEVELYGALRLLGLGREPLDRDVIMAAVRGHFPPLVELGLRRLEKIQSTAEREAVLAAIEHPAPAVRVFARRLLDEQNDGWSKAHGRWWADAGRSGWDALVPDPVPELAQLGIPDVDKLRYRFFASGPGHAVFTTRLPPEAVLAQLAPRRKSTTGAELLAAPKQQEAFATSMKDVETEMREAMAKGDFKKLQEISNRIAKQSEAVNSSTMASSFVPVKEFVGDPALVRYVQLEGIKRRPIQLAVGRDDALGESVLVFRY